MSNDKRKLEVIRKELNRLASEDYADANNNFIELLKSNFLVATIVFTLLGFYFESNRDSSVFEKHLALGIIIALFISLVFGLIQFLIDYRHSRKWARFREKMANLIASEKIITYKFYYKKHMRQLKLSRLENESNVIPIYVQIVSTFIGLILLLIFVAMIIF